MTLKYISPKAIAFLEFSQKMIIPNDISTFDYRKVFSFNIVSALSGDVLQA